MKRLSDSETKIKLNTVMSKVMSKVLGYSTLLWAILSFVWILVFGRPAPILRLLALTPNRTWSLCAQFAILVFFVYIIYFQYSAGLREAHGRSTRVVPREKEAFSLGITALILLWVHVRAQEWEPVTPFFGFNAATFEWLKYASSITSASVAAYFGGYWAFLLFPDQSSETERGNLSAIGAFVVLLSLGAAIVLVWLLFTSWTPILFERVFALPEQFRTGGWLPRITYLYVMAVSLLLNFVQKAAFRGATEAQREYVVFIDHLIGLELSLIIIHLIPLFIYSIENRTGALLMAVVYAMSVPLMNFAFVLSYKVFPGALTSLFQK